MTSSPLVVYFSSVTENTHHFLESAGFEKLRIPIRRTEVEPEVEQPYVLALPTYGDGGPKSAIPKQVLHWLRLPERRALCVGLVGTGNLNFGEKYAAAADYLSPKLGVPVLMRVDLRGTQTEIRKLQTELPRHWETLLARRGLTG